MADPAFKSAASEEGKRRILTRVATANPFVPPKGDEPKPAPKPRRRKKSDGDAAASAPDCAGQEALADPPPSDLPPSDSPPSGVGDDLPPEIIEKCAALPRNDVGNGKRLLYWFGDRILHVREVGWHWWTGTHWEKQGGEEKVQRYAQLTAARIKLECDVLGYTRYEQAAVEDAERAEQELKKLESELMKRDKDEAREERRRLQTIIAEGTQAQRALSDRKGDRARFANSSGNTNKLNGMISQAIPQRLDGAPVSVEPCALDRDPHAFNVRNGTLHFLRRRDDECPDPDTVRFIWEARLQPHNPADYITKCAPVDYDADSDAPQWTAFLERVQPDAAMREFLRDYHGYALTGLTSMQAFVFNTGEGANGKSTFIEGLMRTVGPYGDTLNPESFMSAQIQKSGGQANPDLADLPGVRLLRVSELPDRAKLQENLVKSLTGGEPMKVRHNYAKRFFLFTPVFKGSMSGNSKPDIHDISEGFWRRIMIVPWDVRIPTAERRGFEDMQAEFAAERSGVLNWMIAGCLAFLNNGRLDLPDQVADATVAHRDEMDPIGTFLDACVMRAPEFKVTGGELYAVYRAWCEESGLKPFQQTTFGRTVPKHGWDKVKVGVVTYKNMRLKALAPEAVADYRGPKSPRAPLPES